MVHLLQVQHTWFPPPIASAASNTSALHHPYHQCVLLDGSRRRSAAATPAAAAATGCGAGAPLAAAAWTPAAAAAAGVAAALGVRAHPQRLPVGVLRPIFIPSLQPFVAPPSRCSVLRVLHLHPLSAPEHSILEALLETLLLLSLEK